MLQFKKGVLILAAKPLLFALCTLVPTVCMASQPADSTSNAVMVTALIFLGILVLVSEKLRSVAAWLVVNPFISFGKAHLSLAKHLLPKDVVFPDVAKRSATDQTP